MSVIVAREDMRTILIPDNNNDGTPDGVKLLIDGIKGAVLAEVDSDGNYFVLIDTGDKLEWYDIIECIPIGSERTYTKPETIKLKSV
jgi:hypothetical protein